MRKAVAAKDCSPSYVQVTFTSSTVFSGVACTNITNSNIQQPFSSASEDIAVAFDNTEFLIDTSSASSRVTCYGCAMGAELVGTVAILVSTVSCPQSTSQWALSVRKFFDLVINVTPHVMSVDIGDRIEMRGMVPLLNVQLSDGRVIFSTPSVGNRPTISRPTTNTTTAATTAPPTTNATTAPPTTNATTAPPTTAANVQECPAGSYIKGKKCRLCPIGRYTSIPNQSKCVRCPNGKTTKNKGSTSIDLCQGMSFYIITNNVASDHVI